MKKIFFAAALLAAMASCSKEQPQTTEAPEVSGNLVAVNFSGSQVVVTPTKAGDPALPSGSKAKISAYLGETIDAASAKIVGKDYTAASDGQLAISGGSEMFLPLGDYNFYSVGVIGDGTVPTLDATQATGMVSGVDYIVAKAAKTVATGTDGRKVALPYTHVTSKVLITVVHDATSIDEISSVTGITITPSQGPWTLGVDKFASVATATPVSAVASTSVAMSLVEDKTFTYLMLPLAASKEVSFTISANVKTTGATTAAPATFTGKITSPTGGFVGGMSYAYTAKISSGQITFSSATVSDWTEGTTGETGDLPTTEE